MRSILTALLYCLLTIPIFSAEDEAREDLFLSTPEQIATLASEPSYLIGGVISPLSGQPVLRQTDLIAKGAQSITLTRTYLPPHMPCAFAKVKHNKEEYDKQFLYQYVQNNYKGWQFYPHLRLELDLRSNTLRIADPGGMTLDFRFFGREISSAVLASPPYAISNTAGETPSGQYDPRNTRFSADSGGARIYVHVPDGTTRIYLRALVHNGNYVIYRLDKEILSNGKILKHHYNHQGRHQSIQALDPQERYIYSSMNIEGTPWEGSCHFTTSSGLSADYTYERRQISWKMKRGGKLLGSEASGSATCPPILTSVSSPFYRHESLQYCDRFLLGLYSGRENLLRIANAATDSKPNKHYRAQSVQFPVGQHDAFEPIHTISYQSTIAGQREGSTTVNNSDGTSIVYHFSKNLLTTSIQYVDQNKNLSKEKLFSWDENNWLKSLEVRDGNKGLNFRKVFEYDRFGNPTLEILTGSLTGEGSEETFTTRRIFSDDGRNLLLREESEDGKVVCFTYLAGTNLVTSKFTQDRDQILLREFWVYDDCNNLIQTILDDGSAEDKDNLAGVTQRTLKTYLLRQSPPFLHMPEWIIETYLDAGIEKLLTKKHWGYDQHGNVAEEEVYDSEGKHAYTIYKTYNERGDVLSETNSLGQEAVHTYDEKGLIASSLNFSHRLQTTYQHDTRGRLRKQVEQGDDGITHATSANYDYHDRKIQTKDLFGNPTRYTYNPLVNEVTGTDFPAIVSPEGKATAVTTSATYDPFGRRLTYTDENGNTTTYCRNLYGSPVEVVHPDGGREFWKYAKNGKCLSYTDLDGLTIHYERDVLGRVLVKAYVAADGQTIARETFTYNGFNLLTETDREGNVKYHTYDGAGRKIREEFCGRVTEFSYDHLSRLATVTKHNGTNTLLIHYIRDLEGNILEERKTDIAGHLLYQIQYSYDGDGNRIAVVRFINGNAATETFVYDSFKREAAYRDGMGHETTTVYDEGYVNSLGQKALQTRKMDPLQITRVETQDALSRLVRKEVLNSQNNTIACEEWLRDSYGNVVYHKDHVYEGNVFKDVQTIHYTYTPNHQIASFTCGFGTLSPRTTAYTYFPSGKVATKTLSDGITLSYSYHPLGFMSRLDSSDGTIHHAFDHNLLGHLRSAVDEQQQMTLTREVDPFGNVLRETLLNGLEVEKEYDHFNRPTVLRMENHGKVFYIYDPLFLRQVARGSSTGEILYTHRYEDYDLSGHLLTEKLIGSSGTVAHSTDLNGRKLSISSPYFSQQCEYDPVNNLTNLVTNGVESHYTYDQLSQLSSEKGCSYGHDSIHNRVQKDEKAHEINALNELIATDDVQCVYDTRGNQILRQTSWEKFHFTYDALNRMIEAASQDQKVQFFYDPLDRRLMKIVQGKKSNIWKEVIREYYLYNGHQEMGALDFSSNKLKNLKILGIAKQENNPTAVSIELAGQIFAPILDIQGNIRRLVNPQTKTVVDNSDFTAFGEELQTSTFIWQWNPWRFASKRFDSELGLVYFGKRFYDPRFGRWLTTDPAGFVDSMNLYQYVFNNPFKFADSDGQEAAAIALTLWGASETGLTLAALSGPVGWLVGGAAILTTLIAWKGPEIVQKVNDLMDQKAKDQSIINETISSNRYSSGSPEDPNDEKKARKVGSGKKLKPDSRATGPHTVYRIDPQTGKVIKYETYQPQTNCYDPKPWESVKRYDGLGSKSHYNKVLEKDINVPHVHDPYFPGGVRPALSGEIPK